MTASEIQLELMKWISTTPSDIIVPNYYVGRWEMDVCKVTKVGQMTEYEIKISKADFKKDWDKKADLFTIDRTNLKGYTTEEVTKHQHIQAGKHCNRFYFVCPAELIQPAEVPDGYGLIWVTKRVEQWGTIFTFKVVKRSKLWRQEGQPLELFRHLAVNIGIKYCNVKAKLMRYQQAHKNSTKTNPAGE